jgi:hypothetical protein
LDQFLSPANQIAPQWDDHQVTRISITRSLGAHLASEQGEFYLRRGFRLIDVRLGAVDDARKLKPSIPVVGELCDAARVMRHRSR